MKHARSGFTLIEMVIAVMIGSVLVGLTNAAFSEARSASSLRSAKGMYSALQNTARTRAVELGETTIFVVDTVGDSAFVFSNGQIHDITRFDAELNVDLKSTPTRYIMCMTPRGYADPDCGSWGGWLNATSDTVITLEFWSAGDSTTLDVLPMGQLVGL